ncbi:MAG: hypothetical protein H7145_09475 [Akkermansiaceae bacterium]|nr:hypothetical protein [Armatimonadota bacterium]
MIGWQGYTMRVPDDWDLTGYSGTQETGYFRADDGENLSVEIKWATEKQPVSLLPWAGRSPVRVPNVEVRRESYFRLLRESGKKKKIAVTTKDADPPKGVLRDHDERTAAGFTWSGDKRGIGAVWYCAYCHRVTIAQVTGDISGKGGIIGAADMVIGSLGCHDFEPGKRVWAIYDLRTEIPSDFALTAAQLMNVYLRLSFARSTTRLSVEQWAVANVARKEAYLDDWVAANAKGELTEARYTVSETEVSGKAAVAYNGGPGFGQPMLDVIRDITRFHKPATRFSGLAWEDEAANKIYLVQSRRPKSEPDPVPVVAAQTGFGD